MELDRVEKPLRQMRKLLKKLPSNPAPDEVHKLRTRARKIEAVATALEQADAKQTRRLLKTLKPVRKAAGGVRDMDVLTGDLLQIHVNGTKESLVKLVEHLGMARRKNAVELLDTVDRQRKPARRQLKKYAKLVDSVAHGKEPVSVDVARALDSENGNGSLASPLLAELAHWPRLCAQNIHPFRLKVKELRYVLELYPKADQGLIATLGKVKDEVGEWHDWQQLGQIARSVLDPRDERALIAQIDAIAEKKLTQALASANALRRRYLHPASTQRKAS